MTDPESTHEDFKEASNPVSNEDDHSELEHEIAQILTEVEATITEPKENEIKKDAAEDAPQEKATQPKTVAPDVNSFYRFM